MPPPSSSCTLVGIIYEEARLGMYGTYKSPRKEDPLVRQDTLEEPAEKNSEGFVLWGGCGWL